MNNLGYDSKPVIIKTSNDEYKLCWNVGNIILSILTEDQMLDLRDSIDVLTSLPPGKAGVYHFPVMRHYPAGSAGDLISRTIEERYHKAKKERKA